VTAASVSAAETELMRIEAKDIKANPSTGTAPLKVKFTAKVTSTSSPITGYEWEFGDGETSYNKAPTHIYKNAGVYDVTVIATTKAGGYITYTKPKCVVVKEPEGIKVDFSVNKVSGKHPLKVTFKDKSSNNIKSRLWSFGDGYTSSAKNPTHIYKYAGVYDVSLEGWDNVGNSAEEVKQNYIYVK
jgi:PKD repeat protein